MRVWQFTSLDPTGLGGVEKHIFSVSAELRQMGHQVHIGTQAPSWISSGSDATIIHTHGDTWPSLDLLRLTKRSKHIKWIHVSHGTSIGRLLACAEYFSFSGWRGTARDLIPVRLANAAITVSTQVHDELRRFFRVNYPLKVIPGGVDPTAFKALEKLTSFPRLAFVGRSDDRVKNVDKLVQACVTVHERHSDFELWAFPGFEKKTSFVKNRGPVNGPQLAHALSECRALALVSLYEGDGLVIREAQALGLPVIASRTRAIEQNLEGYANVAFVNPQSISQIATAVEKIIYTPTIPPPTPRLRSWQQVAREFEAFYRQLTSASK